MVIKKSKFIKKQEATRLLNNLGIRTHLSKIPILKDSGTPLNAIPLNAIPLNEIPLNAILLSATI